MTAADYKTGKGEQDENFPVASKLIAARFRPQILAFYRFARAADDIADHATLSSAEKLRLLDRMESGLDGGADADPEALPLSRVLVEYRLDRRHAVDLLNAFRQDAVKSRYATWDELIDYCRLSAMPVGRFVLDVHGESRDTWLASDALCAALQVINHLQDCAKDFAALDRVYLPEANLIAAGANIAMLREPVAPPALRRCLADLAQRTRGLMVLGDRLPSGVRNFGLEVETAVIVRAAHRLLDLLVARDPLSERVHLTKAGTIAVLIAAAAGRVAARLTGGSAQKESRA